MAVYSKTLARIIAKRGACSRSQAFELVEAGRVTVNGCVVTDPIRTVADRDTILVDGKPIGAKASRYILLHKPAGYVTTRSDERGRRTVYDLIGGMKEWVFPVGRLDMDSEGLLIITNDTTLGNILTDPRYRILRTYRVTVSGAVTKGDLSAMRQGVDIGRGETSRPHEVKVLEERDGETVLEVTLTEGKNREIRRLFEALGKPVLRLIRTSYGPFSLGDIPPGAWREIDIRTYRIL